MAYQIIYPWHKHPRLIWLSCVELVTSEDIIAALADTVEILDQSEAEMHVIFDFRMASQLPKDMLQLFLETNLIGHPQRGRCVLIRGNEFASFVLKIMAHQTNIPLEFVADENDAWEFFNEMGIC